MKKVLLLSICLFLSLASIAQNADEIAILQSAYGMDKRAIVTEQMKLTPNEAEAFWPIYEQYEVARKEYGKTRIKNIMEYAKNYQSLSNEKATELINASYSNQMNIMKLQQKTFKQLSKAITPARAAQFTQIEMYLENAIKAKLGDEMPFIEEKK
jgi:Spy/CpxP family protein refolding chaperone